MCTSINFKMSIYGISYYNSFDLSTVCIEMLIQPGKIVNSSVQHTYFKIHVRAHVFLILYNLAYNNSQQISSKRKWPE